MHDESERLHLDVVDMATTGRYKKEDTTMFKRALFADSHHLQFFSAHAFDG
jgi:hypothetical protein